MTNHPAECPRCGARFTGENAECSPTYACGAGSVGVTRGLCPRGEASQSPMCDACGSEGRLVTSTAYDFETGERYDSGSWVEPGCGALLGCTTIQKLKREHAMELEAIARYCDELGVKVHNSERGPAVWLGDVVRDRAWEHQIVQAKREAE